MKKLILILTLFSFSFIQAQVFYGMTTMGGSIGGGAIISFNPISNVEQTVHSFGTGSDGQTPIGSLVYDADNGLFYGMTDYGGSLGKGTIISFNPNTNAEDTVHSFGRGDDGYNPYGDLVYDAGNGLFYGMTQLGGSLNKGAIISFNPITNVEDTIHSFGRGKDGQKPDGNLVYYPGNGLLYGMTYGGGTLGEGAIISFNPTTNAEDTVHSFGHGYDGINPEENNLVYDAVNGLFYGMIYGSVFGDYGVITSFNPINNIEDTVHSFGRGYDGQTPGGSLVYNADNGSFYGMTLEGGVLNEGAIISFDPLTNVEDTVHSFGRGFDGYYPYGDLLYYGSNGLFYGMTRRGGALNEGAIISFNPLTNVEDTVHNFGRGDDGQQPFGNLVLYNTTLQGIEQVKADAGLVNVFPNPNNGKFEIEVKSEELRANSNIEIYNVLGEKVFNETLNQVQGDNSIDLSSQPNGIYLYRVLKADGELIGSGKLIIQK